MYQRIKEKGVSYQICKTLKAIIKRVFMKFYQVVNRSVIVQRVVKGAVININIILN